MFGQVLGKATEVLGKAFLLAGVLPALVLIGGASAILFGLPSLAALARTAGAAALADALLLLVAVLAIAVVIFVPRSRLVEFIEAMPGDGPIRWLRERLIARQLRLKRKVSLVREAFAQQVTAVKWCAERQFDDPGDAPPQKLPWWRVAFRAGTARRTLARLARRSGVLSPRQCRRISNGLLALYAFAASNLHDPRWRTEAAVWKALLQGETEAAARDALDQVAHFDERRWQAEWVRAQAQPKKEKYLQPTEFGNVMASLGDYADERYGIETATLWGRIWWLLPESDRREIGDQRVVTEALVVLWYVLVALLVLAAGQLLFALAQVFFVAPAQHDRLVAPAGTLIAALWLLSLWLAAVLAYRLSVYSLDGLVQKVKSLVDVYHLKLLSTLGLQPKTIGEVHVLLTELGRFITTGEQRDDNRQLAAAPQKVAASSPQGPG
jgi:hypothetical protein